MRLGFDLDGTLADMQSALAREARVLFQDVDTGTLPRSTPQDGTPGSNDGETGSEPVSGKTPNPESRIPNPDDSSLGSLSHSLTGNQQRVLWDAVRARENFWETLDEIEPGALTRLYQLAQTRRWEVIFLTSRPETAGDSAQLQSHRWLAAHGFLTPSVFVVHGSRGKIAAALQLDALVDDRPENCLDVSIDSSARAILVWRSEEDKVPGSARQLGIGAVSSMDQCLEFLESLDSADDRVGMLDRLKRLLGLKPQGRTAAGIGQVQPANRVGT